MKKHLFMLSLLAAGTITTSCSEMDYKAENGVVTDMQTETTGTPYQAPTFAEPDNATLLNPNTPAENLKTIFNSVGPKVITSMGRINITDEQFQEIKTFTDELVKDKTSQTEKYREIFRWVATTIKYETSDNDPYAVFIKKKAVCEGYANLLTVMCHSQEIPTVLVNGYLSTPSQFGGHAWAYSCPDGVWEVSDPTNSGSFPMSNTQGYTHLIPTMADVDLFADDYAVYRYYDAKINVDRVTSQKNPLILPYSAGGFVITSFNPSQALPETITDIYISTNITTFGESDNMGLAKLKNNIQAIHVDENNKSLASHEGIVYRWNGDEKQLYYIPSGMQYIELLPMEKVEKNTIYNHQQVKTIYFPEGTKTIENYAIENCPMLEKVYIPEEAEMAERAIWNCNNNVEVIRGIPSSITPIYAD